MADRTFEDGKGHFSLIKRKVDLYGSFSVSEAVTPVPTLYKWNYPSLGVGVNARTYTAAPSTSALPSGTGPWPNQWVGGAEGVYSITRTAIGLYTLVLQDKYQRLIDLHAYASVAGGTPVFAHCTENTTISNMMPTTPGSIIGLAFWDFAAAAVDPIGMVRIHLELADATEG